MSFAADGWSGEFQMPQAAEDDLCLGDCRLGRLAETG